MNEFKIANIITRKIAGDTLPASEERALDAWRATSRTNEECYRECTNHRSRGEYARLIARYPAGEERERLLRRVRREARRRVARRLAIAVAVAVPVIALAVAGHLARERRDASPGDAAIHAGILPPGSSKAVLVMEDGSNVTLGDSEKELPVTAGHAGVRDANHTLTYLPGDDDGAAGSVTRYNALWTPEGGEYRLVLADGTRIHLNAGTGIRYPVQFARDTREVELSGEAYFEVAREARPFILRASGATIRVTGTSFNVKARAGQARVIATLESGSVEVTCGDETRGLSPGEQLVYDEETGTVETREVETHFYTSWKDGCYYFEKAPLEEILGTLSAWYEIRVTYMDEAARQIAFSGLLNRYSKLDDLLRMFEETKEVTLSVRGKEIIVSKR
ncbi:MAG: FecR domain-containing protein [Odoribacteraceae bacterium]|jgi:ferric-dicitrate binding protein FerR (iron transport regulator)|nr:FecR domain-containing protein [Odoribacteraceae bacterium]